MKKHSVPLNEYEFPESKLADIQDEYEKIIKERFFLAKSARDAFRSFILAYTSHVNKSVFNVNDLDIVGLAKSFGFEVPPKVCLDAVNREKKRKKKGK